jgi:hypothetical protein
VVVRRDRASEHQARRPFRRGSNTSRGETLKVTIHSTEPLDDALRVIGALYNVTLNAVDETTPSQEPGVARGSQRSALSNGNSSRRSTSTTSRRGSHNRKPKREGRSAPSVSTSEIRSWAQANRHAVSSHGTLPASIKAAYAVAHGG